jgi:amino-acid N-acetyltransferase
MQEVTIRHAVVQDAQTICELINYHAERGRMLHRSLESIYECIRDFQVAEQDGEIVGCVAVDTYWGHLAEIRSLAVDESHRGRNIGEALIAAAIDDAAKYGIGKLFALTYRQEWFGKLGFAVTELRNLPEKVWRECLEWYAAGHRHETAMILDLAAAPIRPCLRPAVEEDDID